MSTKARDHVSSESAAEPSGGTHGRLARNAIGPLGVVFMVVATAAPITAMSGNTPYIVGFGVGGNAPGIFLIVTLILSIFSIGYVRLARHITTTGAFYGYVSHGLGQLLGLGSGVLALFAYLIFEVAIAGAFAYFAQSGLASLGIHVEWIWLALCVLVINFVLSYFKISIGTVVLGVFLILEIAILALNAISGVANPGPDGYALSSLNPVNALTAIQGGSVGLALFLGFWSWVGFESTAIYGEESRNPRRTVPIATFVSVIGIGLFYTFVSWASIVTNGVDHALELTQGDNPIDLFLEPAAMHLGQWAVPTFYVLMVTGSFACSLAFHNSASRYLYALGRDQVSRFLTPLGRTHPKTQSPYVASMAQSIIAAILVGVMYATGITAYDTFVLVGLMGTLSILIVQVFASISVIGYFRRHHRDEWHWFTTLTAPAISAIAMIGVIGLLLTNQENAVGGTAAQSWLFPAIPWIVTSLFLLTLVWGVSLRRTAPETYQRIGRLVLDSEE